MQQVRLLLSFERQATDMGTKEVRRSGVGEMTGGRGARIAVNWHGEGKRTELGGECANTAVEQVSRPLVSPERVKARRELRCL